MGLLLRYKFKQYIYIYILETKYIDIRRYPSTHTSSHKLYIYIYIYIYIPGWVIPETQKWYLIPPCLTLSIIRYRSRVKWSNLGKGVASSSKTRCSSYWKGSFGLPSTTVAKFTYRSKVFGNSQKFLFLILKVLFLMKQVKHQNCFIYNTKYKPSCATLKRN